VPAQERVVRRVHEGTGELEELRSAVLALLGEDEKAERKRNEGGMYGPIPESDSQGSAD